MPRRINRFHSFTHEILKNKYLYILTLPGILWFLVFSYLPMIGVVIAFQDFNPLKGLFKSEFVGLKNFAFFFTSLDWMQVTVNTLFLNILFIVTGLVASIALAIMLNEIGSLFTKKITQSIAIFPHFISWTVVAMFSLAFFAGDNGLFNKTWAALGLEPISFYQSPNIWPVILVILKIWKAAGFNAVIYLAAIAGIDAEIYESAKIDGASRLQCIFHLTLPLLKNTAILLFLLSVGGIFYGDFGMIYALVGDNPLLYPTTDVIDTFVFRALRKLGDMGMASAVGVYQSVMGFILVMAANAIAKRYDKESAIF